MKKNIASTISILVYVFCVNCSNAISPNEEIISDSWVFVANEGNGCWTNCEGPGNGSISMIADNGKVLHIENVGYTVHSLEVHNDKLYVIVNQDNKIIIYNINSNGITLDKQISTSQSGPREMVIVDDMLYFTNVNDKDIKMLNLNDDTIEIIAQFNAIPGDIISDGTSLWVSLPMLTLWDKNLGNTVNKIDISSKQVETYIVGRGPEQLAFLDNQIYVSRKYFVDEDVNNDGYIDYTEEWTEYFGISIIGNQIKEQELTLGSPCGGSILTYNNKIYRSYSGGIAPIDHSLIIDESGRIGNYNQSQVYHVEVNNNNIWFGIAPDHVNSGEVKVVNSNGDEITTYKVGINPGDFAYWNK